MDANILINTEGAADEFTHIELSVTTDILGKKAEYDSILSLFAKSTGAHMEPLKSLLCKESEAVGKVAELLNATIEMLRKASVDIDEVETNYAVSKVETNS